MLGMAEVELKLPISQALQVLPAELGPVVSLLSFDDEAFLSRNPLLVPLHY